MARTRRRLLEDPAQFGIRAQTARPRSRRNLWQRPERGLRSSGPLLLNAARGSRRSSAIGPPRCIFVHIGMPARRQGQVVVPRDGSAKHADFAGAGDVDDIGPEALEHFLDRGQMAQICRVEAQILFERDGERAPRQFQRPEVAVFFQRMRAVPCTHTEKRQIVTPRKGFKVAAGVGHAVDLVERVGKIRNARRLCRSWMPARADDQPSCSPSARRRCPSSLHAMRRPPDTGPLPSICTALMVQWIENGARPFGQISRSGRTTPFASG